LSGGPIARGARRHLRVGVRLDDAPVSASIPGKARTMRLSHDYRRRGAPVDHVMTQHSYASADRVFWVVDNGSSHCGRAPNSRPATTTPPARSQWKFTTTDFANPLERLDHHNPAEVADRVSPDPNR